jgi:pimeloyl-ACP methyl ester carboxylesterase
MCVHRTYRDLAEKLAARGVPALRFDYHGTGDSSGDASDPNRLHDWLRSLGVAIDTLRDRTGVGEIGLFGVRFGATLAMQAASERGDVASMALWAPCPSGRAYVRELVAFRLMKQRGATPTSVALAERGCEVAGYFFDGPTLSDLSAVDAFASTVPPASRILMLARDDLPGTEERLAVHLESLGAEVGRSMGAGYAATMRDPQETVVPVELVRQVVEWFAVPHGGCRATKGTGRPTEAMVTLSRPGGDVQEQLMRFGPDRRMLGILSEPTERPLRDGGLALLCLNVGANHHVGPNRMYVRLARELAARGQTVFRFDVGGLGDSLGEPGSHTTRLYSKDSVQDVKRAMSFLAETRGVTRFVLMGLCSGAYLAFHTAIEDPRVTGQVLLNPQTFEWKDGDTLELSARRSFLGTRYYARSLLRRDVWARTLRGEVDVRGITGALKARFKDRAAAGLDALAARARGKTPPGSDIQRAFVELSERGVDTLLVFSANDGGLDVIEKHLGHHARRMRGRKNFELEIVEGADHTFTPIDSQYRLEELVTSYMTRRHEADVVLTRKTERV